MNKTGTAGNTPRSLRALLTGLVDYAGLFPPAQLGMAEAVRNYGEYLGGPHSWMLGRFVVPVARLGEFDGAAAGLLASGEGSTPWRLAALAGNDLAADTQEALKFNCRHWQGSEIGYAIVDSIDVRLAPGMDLAHERKSVPDSFALYVEMSPIGAADDALETVLRSGARAKIRMGGVTPDVFPKPDDVIAFIAACAARRLSFKATAGLHHAIRSEYPLTYETGSKRAPMYGFINVFLAAAALYSGSAAGDARGILMESSMNAFRFDDAGVFWQEWSLSTECIESAREFATSFGSCSFREPVEDLTAAGLLQ